MNFKFSPRSKTGANKFMNAYSLKIALEKRYPLKPNYKSVVPLKIFQTWHTKNLPPKMDDAVKRIKSANPGFEHHLFDDEDCREFIKNNYPPIVLETFDKLIPGAYKADLWRYCVLYKEGGIYLDIKYVPHNGFRFITLTEKEHFVLDADGNSVYNALIASKPGNPILFKAIHAIIRNVKIKFYGTSCLEPTGPKLISKFLPTMIRKSLPLQHQVYNDDKYIIFNGIVILKMYRDYYHEMGKNEKHPHYSILWGQRKIYA